MSEFARKCDYEGGLLNAWFGYGLGVDDIDPDVWRNLPVDVRDGFVFLDQMRPTVRLLQEYVDACLEPEDDL